MKKFNEEIITMSNDIIDNIRHREEEYSYNAMIKNIKFDVFCDTGYDTKMKKAFKIESYRTDLCIEILIVVNPIVIPIFFEDLTEVLRLTLTSHHDFIKKKGSNNGPKNDQKKESASIYEYLMTEINAKALVHGFKVKSRLKKESFDNVLDDYLDQLFGIIDLNTLKKIKNYWLTLI